MRTHSIISLVCACLLATTTSIPVLATAQTSGNQTGLPSVDVDIEFHEEYSGDAPCISQGASTTEVAEATITTSITEDTITVSACYRYDSAAVLVEGPTGDHHGILLYWYIGEIPAGDKTLCVSVVVLDQVETVCHRR